ncbi:hypothetical protein [Mucilaginibacter sp. NFX135]|uniref:hypothetical protein n=1 Tax=Mucilaginibacter sp. NFX135 TaxID=3402687 RepID=UPI003AFB38E1
MAIKLVVFDLAGTAVKDDQEVNKAFHAALKKYRSSHISDDIAQIVDIINQ